MQPPALSSSKTFSTPHNKALYPSKQLPTFFLPSRWRPLVRALPPRFTYSECSVYAAPCTTRPFASGFLRLASSQSSSLLRHAPVLRSFSWLSNSPLQEQAAVCLSVYPWTDVRCSSWEALFPSLFHRQGISVFDSFLSSPR